MEKRKVLILDDEKDFLRIVKLNLEESGKFEVMTLSSVKELIPQLHSFHPEIILSAIGFVASVRETIRIIRAVEKIDRQD